MTDTEKKLLANDRFLEACATWERDRHCPCELPDFLLGDAGLDDDAAQLAFEATTWAVEKEERPCYQDGKHTCVGPHRVVDRWSWYPLGSYQVSPSRLGATEADDVPILGHSCTMHVSFPVAIAYYLTHFTRDLAAKYPPKLATTNA